MSHYSIQELRITLMIDGIDTLLYGFIISFCWGKPKTPSYQCSTRYLLAYSDDVKTPVSKSLASSKWGGGEGGELGEGHGSRLDYICNKLDLTSRFGFVL